MFKPVASLVLISVGAFGLSTSAGAQANARRIVPADSAARSAAASAKDTACQAPATIGEDYQGVPCFYTPAGAPANAAQADPPGPSADSAACQAPATVGEDYAGIACAGTTMGREAGLAPSYSVGEDFSGTFLATSPKAAPVAAHRLAVAPPHGGAAAGCN